MSNSNVASLPETDNGTAAPERPVAARIGFRDRIAEYGLKGRAAFALGVLALISGVLTYGTATGLLPIPNTAQIMGWMIAGNVLITLWLVALIGNSAVNLWRARRAGVAGARLHGRLVLLFALVAVVPSLVVAGFSAATLELGLQAWFSQRVNTVMTSSVAVADRYLTSEKDRLQRDSAALTTRLNQIFPYAAGTQRTLQAALSDEAVRRDLDYGIVFSPDGGVFALISRVPQEGPAEVPPPELLAQVTADQIIITTDAKNDRALALSRLGERDVFLLIGRDVDQTALAHVTRTKEAVDDYETAESRRGTIQIGFAAFYILVSLLVLLSAIWLGLWFAHQIVTPIGALIGAADRVGAGDLTARVGSPARDEDIETLRRTFNSMIGQLKAQRDKLVDTAEELDERRRFTEGVLSGVSAGVISMNDTGRVTLVNDAAADMLAATEGELAGQKLDIAIPELATILAEAQRRNGRAEGDISVTTGDQTRSLHVRVRPEFEGAQKGVSSWIVTFDDMTRLVSAQRMAAWADVARRIAHEIKNPLTPIQLSAERLRRKYGATLEDADVFIQCTDTIVRHVGDIGRMVDEFSSFARMPQPVIRDEEAKELVRRAVFLQDVAHNDIEFEFKAPDGAINLACDHRLVGQALTNILKNAVEAIEESNIGRPEGLKIEAEIQDRGSEIAIIVRDNGPGLPNDSLDLTEPYVTTRDKGTGLGLAIVKKVMEDHGGKVVLENRYDGEGNIMGAQMSLIFPEHDKTQNPASA